MEDKPKTLTVKQVATAINCSRRTVYRLVEKGFLIAPLKVDGSPRWEEMDVDVYLHRLKRGDLKEPAEAESGRQEDAETVDDRPKREKK